METILLRVVTLCGIISLALMVALVVHKSINGKEISANLTEEEKQLVIINSNLVNTRMTLVRIK